MVVGWWPSPSPKNWVFGFFRLDLTLESGFGPVGTGDWGLGLGLDDTLKKFVPSGSKSLVVTF